MMALGAVLVLVVVESFLATPLSAVGANATHTVPAPPGDTATPSATPAARAFAPVVFEQGRSPTPFVTNTPPPAPGDTPTATPAARAFAPAVFEQGRSPTPFVTAPPPTVGPTHTPPAPPEP